jgi:hypothetical protein
MPGCARALAQKWEDMGEACRTTGIPALALSCQACEVLGGGGSPEEGFGLVRPGVMVGNPRACIVRWGSPGLRCSLLVDDLYVHPRYSLVGLFLIIGHSQI